VLPAAVFANERYRMVKVTECVQRLDAIFMALVEHAVIKGETRFVGGVVIAVRENPGPGNGHPVALEAYLAEQTDVLLVVVVQVHRFMGRVLVRVVARQHLHPPGRDRETVLAKRDDINIRKTAASFVVAALTLIGSGCAAPKKICGKLGHCFTSCDELWFP